MAEDTWTNHGEVFGAVCNAEEKPHCQGRPVSVQEHLSAGIALKHVCENMKSGSWDSVLDKATDKRNEGCNGVMS